MQHIGGAPVGRAELSAHDDALSELELAQVAIEHLHVPIAKLALEHRAQPGEGGRGHLRAVHLRQTSQADEEAKEELQGLDRVVAQAF